jgi:DNA mismatch endonuclease (patch repair protein)
MADMFSPKRRSAIMARIRSTGNETTELRFVSLLKRHKICGWRRRSKVFGRPDFVFCRCKVAVFIDGDFWHGNPKKYRLPKSNCGYWEKKIARNQARDGIVNRRLRKLGWKVARFWESDLKRERLVVTKLSRLVQLLERKISRRRTSDLVPVK